MGAFLKAGGVPPDNSITTSMIQDGAVTSAKTPGFAADKDIRALALEVADVKGAALNFPNGAADPFDGDTLATKTNATYDATNDYYHNPDAEDIVSDDSTTWGSMAHAYSTGTTGLNPESIDLAASTSNWWFAIDFGSGNEQDIIKGFWQTGSTGYAGSRVGAWAYSDDDSTWTHAATFNFTQSSASTDYEQSWSSVGSHRYWRLEMDSYSGSAVIAIVKMRLTRQLTTADMTLINNALTASSAPTKGFITVQADPVDAVTANTDLTAEISRDDGTTFTAATLTAGSTNGGFTNYEGTCDISGQPSGTSMKYRVKTLNTKEVRVSGVVLRWA